MTPDQITRSDRDQVVIVDDDDTFVGVADKLAAHSGPGLLHRAVSACLSDRDGRIFLQRRALAKYHFAGRWSNACCTHPRPGESPETAIARRVHEELGVHAVGLRSAGTFTYRAIDPTSGLVEHELDHVFTGVLVDVPHLDPAEAMDWQLVERADADIIDWHGPEFTPWLLGVLRTAGAVRD